METPPKRNIPFPVQSPPPVSPYYYEEEEVTLKDIIFTAKAYWKEIKRFKNLLIIVGLAVLLGGVFVLKTFFEETTYTTGLTFSVGGDYNVESLNFNPLTGEQNSIKPNKIAELGRSGIIIHKVLFDKISVKGKLDFIANHLINIYDYHSGWNKEPLVEKNKHLHLKDFFFKGDKIEEFKPAEKRALNQLHQLVSGNAITGAKGLMSIAYNKSNDLFRLDISTKEGTIATGLMESIYKQLSVFYIELNVGRPKRTLNYLETNLDSISTQLDIAKRQLAYEANRNRNLQSGFVNTSFEKLSREVATIEQNYQRLLANKQNIQLLLESKTPDFQVIDQTFSPIIDAPSHLKSSLIGGFLGIFLGLAFVIVRKIIQDALVE